MSPHEEQAKALLAAAERDDKTFRILARDPEAPVETTLFHVQQAMEKLLKAVLVAKGVVFPRTHDLLTLFDLVVENDLQVPVPRDLMARLGPYAVEFRYLGVIAPEVGLDEALSAVEKAWVWAREVMQ
ncbi:MAG: HEPN domain-containing protein [Pseudomonadota bacterium]|nr:HEPN domain-containing protein [Rhodocyclaceae bacterium]